MSPLLVKGIKVHEDDQNFDETNLASYILRMVPKNWQD